MADIFGGGDAYFHYENFFVREDLAVDMMRLSQRDQRSLLKTYELALEHYIRSRKKSLEGQAE